MRVGRGLGPGQRGRRRAVGGVVDRVGYLGSGVIVVGRVPGRIVVGGASGHRDVDRRAVIGGGAVGGLAERADPFSAAVDGYLAGRSGTVLAAVYDVRTGQSWRLGDGPAQDEASVVKVDILETLLSASDGTGPVVG